LEIACIIAAVKPKFRRQFLVSLIIFLSFAFLLYGETNAAIAPLSSGTLNLSAAYGSADDIPYSLVTSIGSNAVYLAGSTKSFGAGGSDVWLIKVSQRLNIFPGMGSYYLDSIEWRKTFGGIQDDEARGIIQSGDSNYVMAGQTKSYGAGGFDMYLVKVDPEGNLLWNLTYGSALDDGANCVAQAADGGYVLAGHTSLTNESQSSWLVKTDTFGKLEWSQEYPGLDFNSISSTSDGGYVLATKCANAFELIKLDSSFEMQWNQIYNASNAAESRCAVQTTDGGYAVAGWTNSGANTFSTWLIRTDTSGNIIWDRTYGGLGAYSVIQTSDGGYALTGDRAFLLITDSLGNIQWQRNYDALSEDNLQFTRAYSLAQASIDSFIMASTQQSYGQVKTGLDGQMVRVALRYGNVAPPKIIVFSPENKIYTSPNVPLSCYVDKPTVWMAYQIDNGLNVTISGNTTISLPDGRHNMTVYAADGDYNNGASNTVYFSTFAVDTVPINVAVTSSQNSSYTSADVPLSFTVDKAISWAAYSLDGNENITLTENSTLTGVSEGNHTLTVYAQDTLGLVGASDPTYFGVLVSSSTATALNTPTLQPTASPVLSPAVPILTSTPSKEPGFLGINLPLEYSYALVAVLAIIVVAGLSLAYLKRALIQNSFKQLFR
jgi:hypothetical protein